MGAPPIARQALFDQAGIIVAASLGELLDVAVLLAESQPSGGPHRGDRVQWRGCGVLAADACASQGLAVAAMNPGTRSRLREVLPGSSALGGPVDATASVGAEAFGQALQITADQDGVDALIAVVVRQALPT